MKKLIEFDEESKNSKQHELKDNYINYIKKFTRFVRLKKIKMDLCQKIFRDFQSVNFVIIFGLK